jgi:hypothetical protein
MGGLYSKLCAAHMPELHQDSTATSAVGKGDSSTIAVSLANSVNLYLFTPVCAGHRPNYVDSDFCCGWDIPEGTCHNQCAVYSNIAVMQQLQTHIDPLLFEYQVNLAFAGHFHNVQRQAAVYQGKVMKHSVPIKGPQGNVIHLYDNPHGTVHMVIGSAGNGPTYSNKMYAWSEASWDDMYGYAVVTAVNTTLLHWQFIESATDRVVDEVYITQDFSRWNSSHSNIEDTGGRSVEYSYHAQVVVIIAGAVLLALSMIGAYLHGRKTKAALRQINGQHQLLDQSEHSTGSGVQNPLGMGSSSDDGVV